MCTRYALQVGLNRELCFCMAACDSTDHGQRGIASILWLRVRRIEVIPQFKMCPHNVMNLKFSCMVMDGVTSQVSFTQKVIKWHGYL